MIITVSQSALAKALQVVAKGMSSNSTLPLLSGIYLKATGSTLELQTNNLQISVRHLINANVEEEGETVVSGKLLTSIVKNLPDAAVTLSGGDRSISIACGMANYRLNTLDAADWPSFPEIVPSNSIELPADLLSKMVDRAYRVTSRDGARPILQGVLITVENNTITLAATDSYRLVVLDSHSETSSVTERFEAIIPGSVFHDVMTMPSMTDVITIGTTEGQVIFSFGSTTFISQKIKGRFTDYKQIIPKKHTLSVDMGTADLGAALKRVAPVAQSNSSVRLEVNVDDQTLKISASSPDQGEAYETIPVKAQGESIQTAFNYHYLQECVSSTSDRETVTMELMSSKQPGVFISNTDINYLYLLMPVWI